MSMISPVMNPACGRHQEGDQLGDFLGLAEPADRYLPEQRLALVLRELFHDHRSPNIGRRHPVHGDALAGDFPRDRKRQRRKRTLRRRIGGPRRGAARFHRHGTDIHDPSPAHFPHAGKEGPRHVEGTVDIDRHEPPPLLWRCALGLVVGQDPGIVDQRVDNAVLLPDGETGTLHRLRVADVHDHARCPVADPARQFLQRSGGDIHQEDMVAVGRKSARDGLSKRAGRAGDDRQTFPCHFGHSSISGARRPR